MTVDAQVETVTRLLVAHGYFPSGVTDSSLEIVVVPDAEAPKLEQPGTKHVAPDGTVTVTPPPPTVVFSADQLLEGQVRTTDATPTEIVRVTLGAQTGYTGQVNVIGVDGGNGAVRVIRASFAIKRLNGGALGIGAPVVLASHGDAQAASWAITSSVAGNDAIVSVQGAAGRTIDWIARGQIMSFAPGGI